MFYSQKSIEHKLIAIILGNSCDTLGIMQIFGYHWRSSTRNNFFFSQWWQSTEEYDDICILIHNNI